jgi:hypothetical protein
VLRSCDDVEPQFGSLNPVQNVFVCVLSSETLISFYLHILQFAG